MSQLALYAKVKKLTEQRKRENKLAFYKPYDWQLEFHAQGASNQERMLRAANRVGKCITYQTLIDTPAGKKTVGELYELGKSFDIWAYDGRVIKARATAPFKKPGLHRCYRLLTSYGWVECADYHRVLLDGSWQHVQHLVESGLFPLVSNSARGPSIRGEDDQRWFEKLRGFLGGCLQGCHFGGGQLQLSGGSGLGFSLRQADVPRRNVVWWCLDDLARRYTNIRRSFVCRPSSTGALRRTLGLFFGFLGRDAYRPRRSSLGIRQEFLPLAIAGGTAFRSVRGDGYRVPLFSSWRNEAHQKPNVVITANEVIGYEPIGWQEVYDFTVAKFHNYVAGGLVHHNTESAAAEVAMHLTGGYDDINQSLKWEETDKAVQEGMFSAGDLVWPDGWPGIRFDKPTLVWVGSPTNETSRDIVQKALFGGTGEEMGTGWVPKRSIIGKPKMRQAGVSDVIDTGKIRHKSGGVSTVVMKTYEQGWRKWQGTEPDVVWPDEEPEDYKIYTEILTRVMTSQGTILVTFTPLLGETELVIHFAEPKTHGISLMNVIWDQAPHLEDADKDRLKASYPDHEVQARTMGVPMMGEGRVFTVSEEDIRVDPFEIPRHWAQIAGIDFGLDHPFAVSYIAWDRDNDVIYVHDGFRVANQLPVYHAKGMKKRPPWIPISWPHDGLNREKKGGEELWKAYVEEGLNMISKSARYAKKPGEKEKGGAQPQEPIILEILDRMKSGRFKVFSNLTDWFSEFRSYHRKDGKLVSIRDDFLKSTFYAVMMKRYAATGRPIIINRPSAPIVSARI